MEIGIGTMLSTSSIPSRRIAPLNNVFLSLRCPTKTPIATFHHAHLNFKLKLKLLSHLQANSILFQCYCNNWRSIPSTKPITELGLVRAYIEKPDPVKEFASKIIGSLPILGLLSRILSDEGGIAGDRIQFAEFCSRVQKKCTPEASRAFYDFGQRHGKTGNPRFVLIWCWVAALGAGLVKSEEILLGASRLRVSFDMQYEEETFNILMDEATELPLAPDVDLGAVASLTKGFSGADLQSLLSDAQLESVHGFLENAVGSNDGTSAAHPLITNLVLESVVLKARPSVPKNEKQRLYEIYSQFLNSRTSVAAKDEMHPTRHTLMH